MAEIFEVEKVVASKRLRGRTLYKVRWRSYGPEDDTWEPASHLKGCRELLDEFRAGQGQNANVAVNEPAKIVGANLTKRTDYSVETPNSRVTVGERGDWRDDRLLRRSTLQTSQVTPEKMEMTEEDTGSKKEDAPTSPFVAFLCILFIASVILLIYVTSK